VLESSSRPVWRRSGAGLARGNGKPIRMQAYADHKQAVSVQFHHWISLDLAECRSLPASGAPESYLGSTAVDVDACPSMKGESAPYGSMVGEEADPERWMEVAGRIGRPNASYDAAYLMSAGMWPRVPKVPRQPPRLLLNPTLARPSPARDQGLPRTKPGHA
jgi:hypothetical protein